MRYKSTVNPGELQNYFSSGEKAVETVCLVQPRLIVNHQGRKYVNSNTIPFPAFHRRVLQYQ